MEMRTIPGTNLQLDFTSKSAIAFEMKFEPSLDSILKKSQFANPSVFSTSTEQQIHMQYGEMKPDSSIPFTSSIKMEPMKIVVNEKNMNIPSPTNGLTVFGGFRKDKKPYYDSISGGNFRPDQKQIIIKAAEQSLAAFSFFDRKLFVGDTICRKMPINLPLPGASKLSMDIIVTYKLREIKEPFSFFDLTYDISSQAGKDSVSFSMSISGKGEMTYDNAHFYTKTVYGEFDMQIEVKSPDPLLTAKGHITSKIDGVLTLNTPGKMH